MNDSFVFEGPMNVSSTKVRAVREEGGMVGEGEKRVHTSPRINAMNQCLALVDAQLSGDEVSAETVDALNVLREQIEETLGAKMPLVVKERESDGTKRAYTSRKEMLPKGAYVGRNHEGGLEVVQLKDYVSFSELQETYADMWKFHTKGNAQDAVDAGIVEGKSSCFDLR